MDPYFMTDKSSIALDLDGVVTDISEAIVRSATTYTDFEIAESLFNKDGFPPYEYIFEKDNFWNDLLPIKESWHKVNEWFYSGFDIYFITARRSKVSIDAIETWLDKWRIPYTDVFVTDMFDKHSVVDKLNPLVFVDDNPFEINKIKNKSNGSIDALVMKTWYNHHIVDTEKYITSLLDLKIG